MADSASTGGESLDALAARLDRLNQKMDQAKGAASTAKAVSIVVAIVIAAAAIIGVLILLSPVKAAIDNPEPYQKALMTELEDSIGPAIQEELQGNLQPILKDVGKSVGDAFKDRQEEIFVGVNDQIQVFTAEMQEFGMNQVQDRRTRVREYIQKAVVAEVPELQDEEKTELVLANAAGALDNVVRRVMDEHLSGHMELMISIENHINKFPVPDKYKEMDRDELTNEMVDQLGLYAMSIFRETIHPHTREFLRAVVNDEQE